MTVCSAIKWSLLKRHRHPFQAPDSARVFADRAVGRELAGVGRVRYRHPRPAVGIEPGRVDLLLARNVSRKIGEHEKRI